MTQYPDDIDAPQSPQRHPAAGLDGSPAAESGDALDNSAEESVNGSMKSQSLSAAAAEPIGLLDRELMPKRAVSYLRVSTREQAERGGREEGFSKSVTVIVSSGALIIGVVVCHNLLGYLFGYLAGRLGGGSDKAARTTAVEVGMQNSGMAATLAATQFPATPETAVPAAVFSVWHNLSGALLAMFFRRVEERG